MNKNKQVHECNYKNIKYKNYNILSIYICIQEYIEVKEHIN